MKQINFNLTEWLLYAHTAVRTCCCKKSDLAGEYGVLWRVRIHTRSLNFKIHPYVYPYPHRNFSLFWTRTHLRTSELKTIRNRTKFRTRSGKHSYPHPYPYLKFGFFAHPIPVALPVHFPYFVKYFLIAPLLSWHLNLIYVMLKSTEWHTDRAKQPTINS